MSRHFGKRKKKSKSQKEEAFSYLNPLNVTIIKFPRTGKFTYLNIIAALHSELLDKVNSRI